MCPIGPIREQRRTRSIPEAFVGPATPGIEDEDDDEDEYEAADARSVFPVARLPETRR